MTKHRWIAPWLPIFQLALFVAPLQAGQFVGIPDREFATHYRSQHATEWCWASCVEMALSYEGVELPQESIVARSFGSGMNIGGLPEDIVASTSGLFRTESGRQARISGSLITGAPSATAIYRQLSRRQPVIMLYKRGDGSGHAVVVTGIEVEPSGGRPPRISKLHVFDPSAGTGDRDRASTRDPSRFLRIFKAVHSGDRLATETGPIDGVILVNSTIGPAEVSAYSEETAFYGPSDSR